MMGPSATQALGEMGADVIKVESPEGDPVRQIGPGRHQGMGGLFLNANAGKRSIGIDLKSVDGRQAMLRIAETCDVLIYNIRPQAMARLGLSYEAVSKVRTDIIYIGLFGFGQDGPYAARPAYDDLIQGATLIPSLLAQVGDGIPRYVPSAIADRVVGMSAVSAVCAALFHRSRTGKGQQIGIPMFETMVSFVLGDHLSGLSFEPPIGKGGYARLLTRQRRPYQTKDGYICALLYNDKHWVNFYRAVGEDSRASEDPRLASMESRNQHIDELYREVSSMFQSRTTQEWMDLLEKADVPCMPFHDLRSIFDDRHLAAVNFFLVQEHPSEGHIRRMRSSAVWSETPLQQTRHAPRHGEHTAEILHEVGMAPAEIERLIQEKAVLGVTEQRPQGAPKSVPAGHRPLETEL